MPASDKILALQIRQQFVAPVNCGCGQHGTAIWEENIAPTPRGRQPLLVEVSSGFYIRLARRGGARSEIACGLCDKIVGFSRASHRAQSPPLTG